MEVIVETAWPLLRGQSFGVFPERFHPHLHILASVNPIHVTGPRALSFGKK